MLIQQGAWARFTNKGASSYRNGQPREANRSFHQAYREVRRRNDGGVNLAISLYNLAVMYHYQRRYRKAVTLLEKSLAIFQKHYGIAHLRCVDTLDKLAELHVSLEDYTSAISCYESAQEAHKEIVGHYHEELSKRLMKVAYLNCLVRDFEKACHLYVDAVGISFEAHQQQKNPARGKFGQFGSFARVNIETPA